MMKRRIIICLSFILSFLVLVSCATNAKETNAIKTTMTSEVDLATNEIAGNETKITIEGLDQLKCLEVITRHITSQLTNDFDSWLETMTDRKKLGFTKESNGEFGITRMEIQGIYFLKDSLTKNTLLNSSYSKEMGWNNDNVIAVRMDYFVEYDHAKVPFGDGQSECEYILVKKPDDSSWFIEEWSNHGK